MVSHGIQVETKGRMGYARDLRMRELQVIQQIFTRITAAK
jgi:fructose-specific phosphotransferase system component IIB